MTYEDVLKIKHLIDVYDRKICKHGRMVLFKFSCYLEEIVNNYLQCPKRSYIYKSSIERLEDIKQFYSFYIYLADQDKLYAWKTMEILLSEAIEEQGFDVFVPELYELIVNDCLMTTDLKVTLMKLSKNKIDDNRFEL